MADTQERLQMAVDEWSKELQRKGLEINPTKSMMMLVSRDVEDQDPVLIMCNNEPLERVDNNQYLGTII